MIDMELVTLAVLGCHTERCEREFEAFERQKEWQKLLRRQLIGTMPGQVVAWDGYRVVPMQTKPSRPIDFVRSVNLDGTCEVEMYWSV